MQRQLWEKKATLPKKLSKRRKPGLFVGPEPYFLHMFLLFSRYHDKNIGYRMLDISTRYIEENEWRT